MEESYGSTDDDPENDTVNIDKVSTHTNERPASCLQ